MQAVDGNRDERVRDYIVALVGAGGVPVRGGAKLQKMLFLLADDLQDAGRHPGYLPYDHGPHSRAVGDNPGYLEGAGMVSVDPDGISLADRGMSALDGARRRLDGAVLELIDDYKEFLNDMDPEEVLAFVYCSFPTMARPPEEYGPVSGRLDDLITSVAGKKKITVQRGAELLGISHERMIDRMKRAGSRVAG
ncbi:MAG: hypothetical protein MPJ02_06415 [Nitrosopumilus sp.]|nr:hypothetical protein [Nitrosopumilus sp.]MDA7999200.1 hypothetical protein [Nitrosopumilus sp.]